MKPILPPDSHYVSAAAGWLGLRNWKEAYAELERVTPENRAHPDVLELLWHIYSKSGKWNVCLDIAEAIIKLDPQRPFGWVHRSVALHKLQRTQEAFDKLRPAADQMPTSWAISYKLSCLCAQLGRFIECQLWLNKAMAIDKETVKRAALIEPDLKPLWVTLSGQNAMNNLVIVPQSRPSPTAASPTLVTPLQPALTTQRQP